MSQQKAIHFGFKRGREKSTVSQNTECFYIKAAGTTTNVTETWKNETYEGTHIN